MPTLFIPGPCGQLETLLTQPDVNARGLAIICHPHPQHAGTMHNKVVTTIAKAFELKNYVTLRFNYRGVGASAGEYGHMLGETEDALSIYAYAKKHFPQLAITLAGFSFGAYIAASVANQRDCRQLISVAPAVNHAKFATLNNIGCPWFVFQGEQDEIVPATAVQDFVRQSAYPIQLSLFADTSHFFHGKLIELREALLEIIL